MFLDQPVEFFIVSGLAFLAGYLGVTKVGSDKTRIAKVLGAVVMCVPIVFGYMQLSSPLVLGGATILRPLIQQSDQDLLTARLKAEQPTRADQSTVVVKRTGDGPPDAAMSDRRSPGPGDPMDAEAGADARAWPNPDAKHTAKKEVLANVVVPAQRPVTEPPLVARAPQAAPTRPAARPPETRSVPPPASPVETGIIKQLIRLNCYAGSENDTWSADVEGAILRYNRAVVVRNWEPRPSDRLLVELENVQVPVCLR